ncbi:MAG TPA: LacI family DNA-binding transcriptional regulator [Terriglobia bacterium]|nr:LacI family DNA-binding transcriptional regulator [Terriglobia bacterium]
MQKKVTYQEVARCAKVSISTVARVANGNARVDPQIRERVRRAMLHLGAELQGRKKKNQTLAFILSNREMLHPFHSHVLVGAEAASSAHGYSMLFLCFHYPTSKPPRELHLPPILESSQQISGVILAGTNSPNLLELLVRRRCPFAVLGNNVLGEWESGRYDTVWFDDLQGAYETTQHLQALGHRDVWYAGNNRLTWYARRYEGYRRAMAEAGLPARLIEFDSVDDAQLGYLAAKSILSRGEPVTAIFAGGDQAAQGACKALNERGLQVPEDVSVAGFNDVEAAMWHPPLTSVRVFPEQISKRMVELLVNRINDPGLPPQHSVIPTQLVKRESCDRFLPKRGPLAGERRSSASARESEPKSDEKVVSNEENSPS